MAREILKPIQLPISDVYLKRYSTKKLDNGDDYALVVIIDGVEYGLPCTGVDLRPKEVIKAEIIVSKILEAKEDGR